MSYELKQIAALLDLEYRGDGKHVLRRVSDWETADADTLVFIEDREPEDSEPGYLNAGCILTRRDVAPEGRNVIYSSNPKLDFARAATYLYPRPVSCGRRHFTAYISRDAKINDSADVGPFAVIEAGAEIGEGCIVQSRALVGRGCRLGRECILYPGVILYPGARIGDRVILHAGVVVGGDGFGYVFDGQRQWKFPQIGSVVLEDDVEIGCNTTIDRGSLGITHISEGAKIDNLVQIAHNVKIGKNVVIAAQTGISGSTVIEDDAVIGGQVGFGDHARVQKGAVIGSKAGVLPGKIVRGGETYWGVPVRPLKEYKRLHAYFGRIPDMKADIEALKEEVTQLREAMRKFQD